MWPKRMIERASLMLVFSVMAAPLLHAAELSGKVYRSGRPAANLSITVEGGNIETRTNGTGDYRLDLPPGKYVLVIRGQRFSVTVSSERTRQDIRL